MADDDAVVRAVVDAVAADDAAGVVAALRGASETQRRAAWKALGERHRFTLAGTVAALGCAPGARSAADGAWVLDASAVAPLVAQVLTERRPAWLEDLAVRLVDRESGSRWGFAAVRALVRDGVIAAPTDPSYPLAMAWGVVPWPARSDGGSTPLSALRADSALLDGELWELLGTERAGRSLAQHDRWHLRGDPVPGRAARPRPEATWRHALVTLVDEGAVPRDRLIEATLHAMLADWAAADVGWFAELHDAMAPSAEELAARAPTYLRLLAGEVGAVVQVGLRAAGRLLEGGVVGPAELAPALRPTLLRTQKGTAMAALTLLARAGEADPTARALLADVARLAQDHPRADVRERAAEIVRGWLPEGDRSGASVPLAEAPPPVLAAPEAVVSAPEAEPVTPEPVTPVADADELAEVLAHLIEEADDPVDVERALDGVLRFGGARPAAADALAARARERLTDLYPGPWSGKELRVDLAALVLVWLGHARPGPGYRGRTVGHDYTRVRSDGDYTASEVKEPDWSLPALVSMRVHEVATGIRHGPAGLLSLPTDADGSLVAAALGERLRGRPGVLPLDLELAILRVPPAERGELRFPRLLRRRDAAVRALDLLEAHAAAWQRVVGPTTGEYPQTPPVTMVGWADPASPAGAPDRLVAAVLDQRAPLDRAGLEANDGEYMPRPEQATAMWPLMLPHHLDHLAAHVHPRLARALGKNRSGAVPVIEAIGRSPHRGGPPTWSALALALAAKDPTVRTAAIDSLVLRAGRGLVDADGLGEQLRLCLSGDLVVGTRVVDGLAEAARADRRCAAVVLDVLAATLEVLPGRRDAHRWLELAADLTNDLGRPVRLPQPFRELAGGVDRGVLARACRRVRVAD